MANSNSVGSDYTKLTVPQLKARCKELDIAGYSKLGKAALLEKLARHENLKLDTREVASPLVTSTTNQVKADASAEPRSVIASSPITPDISVTPATIISPDECDKRNLHGSTIAIQSLTTSSAAGPAPLEQAKPKQSTPEAVSAKRAAIDPIGALQSIVRKKRKLSEKVHIGKGRENVPPTGQVIGKSNCNLFSQRPSTPGQTACSARLAPKALGPVQSIRLATRGSSGRKHTSKRFRPLASRPKSGSSPAKVDLLPSLGVSLEQTPHLDFSSAPLPQPPDSYDTIGIPPSLSERKRINAWSVILCGLSDAERRKCALVSRAIRYAVYLSAIPIIVRQFGSRRLSRLAQKYSMSMTNFWPYLKRLHLELAERRNAYSASFLSKFFGDRMPVAANIWGCPNNEKQLTVALRFLMTRLWFAISLNQADVERVKNTIVIDAQEIVKDEIWKVTALAGSSGSAKNKRCSVFYVLEATCEVIGLPQASRDPSSGLGSGDTSITSKKPFLRTDWSDYIHHRITSVRNGDEQFPLLYYLKTTNAEEYKNGISTLWLRRISAEKEVGQYKKKVAERYVLACVVGNSMSGKWMPSSHMAQILAGTASESDVVPTSLLQRESQRVNLFLPAHHLVESVHFTTSKTQNLHPALAVVQTPGREYFILKDNGMEVGCEEDGLWPVWRDLLGCDARGVACP